MKITKEVIKKIVQKDGDTIIEIINSIIKNQKIEYEVEDKNQEKAIKETVEAISKSMEDSQNTLKEIDFEEEIISRKINAGEYPNSLDFNHDEEEQ